MKRGCWGSFLIEASLASVLASALLVGALFVGRAALAARRAHALARHAAALAAVGVPSDVLEGELRDYAGRLNLNGVTWTTGRYAGSSSAAFYQLTEAVVSVTLALPPLVGGGTTSFTERAVVEEDRP
jgi:hypothetical protein